MLDDAGTAKSAESAGSTGGAESTGTVGTAGTAGTAGSGVTGGGIPSRGRSFTVARALLRPLWRTLPRRSLMTGAVLGLLLAGVPRLFSLRLDTGAGLNLLRAAALTFALGLAFLLDDPARHITAAVPTRRPVRVGLRVALVAPSAVLWWTAALFLIPEQARPPMGAATLEAAATALLATAAAAIMVRFTNRAEPGGAVCVGLLAMAVLAPLLLPHRWTLFPAPSDPRWDGAHQAWVVVLVTAALAGAWSSVEPLRTWRPAVFAHR
ncbi:ABC transporter [Streptomyces sp. NPDC059340]|uniref:ABC transporter n=1 Tax=Streptomyces sp. NPDC059340 TaxID=3346806 RepID=UPI00369B06A2